MLVTRFFIMFELFVSLYADYLLHHILDADTATPKIEWTRNRILTSITLSLMSVSLCISFGIISPFYPSEAAKKGASTTEVGLVFGVFQLVMFITSPIYGSYVSTNNYIWCTWCILLLLQVYYVSSL